MENGWNKVKIGDVALPLERSEIPVAGTVYRQIGVRLWGQGAYERESIDGSQTKYSTLSRVVSGDIIVNKIWARNGSVAVVTDRLTGCYGSGEFPTFVPDRLKLEPKWFHWITKTKWFWQACDEKSQGTSGKNRIRPEIFLDIEIPLPPLEEQHRIVGRIEALAGRVSEAQKLRREAVKEAEVILAAKLINIRHYLQSSDNSKRKIGDIATVTSGGTPSRDNLSYWNGNIPWIKTGELLDGDIFDTEEYITQQGMENSSAKLFPPGTILIALYGQGQTRGRTGHLMIKTTTNQACCAILPTLNILEPRFTQYWMRSLYYELREKSHGGAQPNWNGAMIKNIEITLPSLDEQYRIVAYLDGLLAQVDALRQLQAETQKELDALMPSILDRAFKGEL